jgi:NADH-quinone oxidoreductase subunit H
MEQFLIDTFGDNLLVYLIIPVPVLIFLIIFVLGAVLAERKVSAYMQDRYGPNRVGRGILQTMVDGIKLVQKEDTTPANADKLLYNIAPFIVFVATFMGYAVIPFCSLYIGTDLNVGIFFFLAITSLSIVGILLAGWSSNNKYSLFGAMRSVAQIVSYEIPTALSILVVVMIAGTLSMQEIVELQGGGIFNWFIFGGSGSATKFILLPFLFAAFMVLYISTLAETNRTPFDIPEAESELVAGFHTEYSGMKFAMFFFAEYGQMFAVSAVVATLFLGGWQSPFGELIPILNTPIAQIFWFLIKGIFFVFIQMWLRWTLPRLRVDQLMILCWKYLIPVSFINLFAVGLYIVL